MHCQFMFSLLKVSWFLCLNVLNSKQVLQSILKGLNLIKIKSTFTLNTSIGDHKA
jgi:hypothetical protein